MYASEQRKLTDLRNDKKINQQEGIAVVSVFAQNNRPAKIYEAKNVYN